MDPSPQMQMTVALVLEILLFRPILESRTGIPEHKLLFHNVLVVLNPIAKSVIEEARGQHPEFVFTYRGKAVDRMLRSAWRKARVRAGLPHIRVHDLKHTFGRRLRAAGVSFEDRQDLLGHKSGRITTHYSTAELSQLIAAASKVCGSGGESPALSIIKRSYTRQMAAPAKVPQGVFDGEKIGTKSLIQWC